MPCLTRMAGVSERGAPSEPGRVAYGEAPSPRCSRQPPSGAGGSADGGNCLRGHKATNAHAPTQQRTSAAPQRRSARWSAGGGRPAFFLLDSHHPHCCGCPARPLVDALARDAVLQDVLAGQPVRTAATSASPLRGGTVGCLPDVSPRPSSGPVPCLPLRVNQRRKSWTQARRSALVADIRRRSTSEGVPARRLVAVAKACVLPAALIVEAQFRWFVSTPLRG